MSLEVNLPQWGMGMNDAMIVKWLVKEGDDVKKGDPLVEVESAKVNSEVESPGDGKIGKILSKEEEVVPVGDVLAIILEKGETLGVVGASGSGKTTLVKLLARLYDVNEGSICIENKNIQEITLSSLRKSIAYVSQDSYLFSGTLRENIEYGQKNVTEQQIIEATKTARIHEFISTLPDGYDTVIGERGVTLSGGQRQRVALARALIKQSPIFVIDEATRYLDTETESDIRESLSTSSSDRITIIISHRLASVYKSTKIIVLDHGKIIASGSHEDLLKNSPLYASLWKSQSTST